MISTFNSVDFHRTCKNVWLFSESSLASWVYGRRHFAVWDHIIFTAASQVQPPPCFEVIGRRRSIRVECDCRGERWNRYTTLYANPPSSATTIFNPEHRRAEKAEVAALRRFAIPAIMPPEEPHMAEIVHLSETAVAVLRFRVKGWRFPVRDRDRDAFLELVAAGNMAPDGLADYRFTEEGFARRHEVLATAEAHLLSLIPHLPDRIELSAAAKTALRRYLSGGDEVTDANRPAYRELARAGIMMSVGTFTNGDDCVFRFTYRGGERRFEFAEMSCPKETA
jgi:hypothetical protein